MELKSSALAIDLMLQFADLTGLRGAGKPQRRYLWTDAFAVCNFLELFRLSREKRYRDLALRLVEQVHQTLGRHREDDPRSGWISGLGEEEGKQHPTLGGLRIGKKLPELQPDEPADERLEWDRDGQYYHYLTKWMHALHRVSRVTGDPVCRQWGIELAKTAHSRFLYGPPGQQRMYWKMSIDLSRPLVTAMGQHDPLDGLVTFGELQAADGEPTASPALDLGTETTALALLCRGQSLVTDDPLGIGGLLFDACRMSQLRVGGHLAEVDLLAPVLDAAERGLEAFAVRSPLRLQPIYRLPFRELGLAIGLRAFGKMRAVIESNPDRFDPSLRKRTESLRRYEKFREPIESFWSEPQHQETERWLEHREINMVMLATSLEPEGFLAI